jgi:hypothetical protein
VTAHAFRTIGTIIANEVSTSASGAGRNIGMGCAPGTPAQTSQATPNAAAHRHDDNESAAPIVSSQTLPARLSKPAVPARPVRFRTAARRAGTGSFGPSVPGRRILPVPGMFRQLFAWHESGCVPPLRLF